MEKKSGPATQLDVSGAGETLESGPTGRRGDDAVRSRYRRDRGLRFQSLAHRRRFP